MLHIPGTWIWDSWPIDDGNEHHLFFLQAKQAGHHDDRHVGATIGHAVSTDWESWSLLPTALGPAPAPSWDDLATWTGSVVRGDRGWHLFYSAVSRAEGGRVQRIGRADSDDLVTWRRFGDGPVSVADPRWYETEDSKLWREVAWRDPWVLKDPDGDGWHMLLTGRAREGARFDRGVIAHAWSADLAAWEARPPLTARAGFGQLEVPHVARIGDRHVLVFCCMAEDLDPSRRTGLPETGMWSAPSASPLGPFDMAAARPFDDPQLYAAHVVHLDDGRAALLGFRHLEGGRFVGAIPAPVPVELGPDGTIRAVGRPGTEVPR